MRKIPGVIKEVTKKLRKNMTESEKILWNELKARKFINKKFLRQVPVYVFTEDSWLERYIIPDFLCREYNLIIELDGSVHNLKEIYELDEQKEMLLENLWYKIIRFKNEEILNNLHETLNKIAASFSW